MTFKREVKNLHFRPPYFPAENRAHETGKTFHFTKIA